MTALDTAIDHDVAPDADADALLAGDLRRAADLVDRLGLPVDLRPVAFGHTLRAFAALRAPDTGGRTDDGGPTVSSRAAPGQPEPTPATPPRVAPTDAPGGEAERWSRLRGLSDVPAGNWDRLIALRDGRVELAVAKSRLPSTARAATRDAVLLLGAAHAGLGEDTPLEEVQAELARYGRLSSGHFREYVDMLDDVVTVARDGRTYRLLPDAWEALPATVSRLLGRDTASGTTLTPEQGKTTAVRSAR